MDERTAGGEIVGGGAGGRGKNEAVAKIIRHELAVRADFEPHEAGVELVLDQHVDECETVRAGGG